MGAHSRDHAASISVLVAWDGPDRDAGRAPLRPRRDPTRDRRYAEGTSRQVCAPDSRLRPTDRARGRRTRDARPAPTGIGAVVVEGDSAWTATRGAVDAYLLRDGRMARIGPASAAHRPARAALR